MLRELSVKNFLSYGDEKIEFLPDATAAIVGDNGAGKSSLLEAIPFCLFGDGREDLKGLIRLGSTGGMKTSVVLSDVPGPGRTMRVERGVTDSGSGYTKVWVDDTLIEKGGAKPTNNKAQEFIDTTLGMDRETFGLTSFFGLGANDTLMQVPPSTRLETLQKLAGIDICGEFHKSANDKAKVHQEAADRERRAIEVLSESIEDREALLKELRSNTQTIKDTKVTLDDLFAQRVGLRRKEDRFQGLLRERDVLRVTRDTLSKQTEKLTKVYVRAQNVIEQAKVDNRKIIQERDWVEKTVSDGNSFEELQEKNDHLLVEKASLETTIQLKRTALEADGNGKCPLCGSDLTGDSCKNWNVEIKQALEELSHKKESLDAVRKQVQIRKQLEKKLESFKHQMEDLTRTAKEAEVELNTSAQELKVIESDLQKAQDRMAAIQTDLKGYDDIVQEMQSLDKKIGVLQTKVGSLEQAKDSLKARMQLSKDAQSKIKALEETVFDYVEKARAYKVVAEAFSRYAIPVQLLRNLRNALESRATRIYQQFSYGMVQIRDTEGARPGVEFVLKDEMGERPYKSLSAGEKVMVFLAVRVALTQIINGIRNNQINFLILDEVAGNLSPNKREALTKLINSLLRKYFTQVLMVSHVELRDIFTKTYHVEKVDGVSRVA